MTLVQKELKNAYIGIPFPESIVLDKSLISLTTIGQTEQLTATIEPTISDHSITWSSDDTTVATVSTTGLVTCVTPGTATITATTVNGLTATCSVDDNQGWQPGANTIVYYKFDGNLNDDSSNGYNLTGTDITYNTLSSGIQVAYFNGTSSYAIKTGLNINLTEGTLNIWLKKGWNKSSETWGQLASNAGGWRISPYTTTEGNIGHLLFYNDWIFLGGNNTGISNGNRMNVVSVINSSGNALYINGQQVVVTYNRGNASSKVNTMIWDTLVIGRHQVANADWTKGEASNWIVESKARTAQEVADYYNQTKANYGL